MAVKLEHKHIYARGRRHQGECYNAVLNPAPNSQALAFLQTDGNRERLLYQPSPDRDPTPVTELTYVLSPCFANDTLCWVEAIDEDWQLRGVTIREGNELADAVELAPTTGRAMSLSACPTDQGALLAWEERCGKRVQVRLGRLEDNKMEEPVTVSPGGINAYDPSVCVDRDGQVHVAYCGFADGNYRIFIQPLNHRLEPTGDPVRVSDHALSCVYPSICAAADGGVWFSYTCFDEGHTGENSFVKHQRFLAQRTFCTTQGTAHVALFREGRTYGVFAPPSGRGDQGFLAAGIVFGVKGIGHTQVFTDTLGRLRLLMRRHEESEEPLYSDADEPLRRAESKGVLNRRNKHPDISILMLLDRTWSDPVCLLRHPHLEAPLSMSVNGDNIRVAFTEDARHTGWNKTAEYFDAVGELGVGTVEASIGRDAAPDYELRPLVISPRPASSIENPDVPHRDGTGFIHAIGQTHTHTNLSVCIRERDRCPHLNYRFMQDVQHSDFGATTDHAYNMWHTENLITRKLAEYYYFKGEFVAIPAYEWTGSQCSHEGGPWGHVNPLFLEETGDLGFYTPIDPECPGGSLPRLWKTFGGQKIVTPPHHVADNLHRYNWEIFDPQFVPIIELFQDLRGSGEKPWAPGVTNFLHIEDGHWAVQQLKAGRRFGFIASADHSGHARAGVLTMELTRTALYEAFMARRCFATTNIGMRLEFTCNGKPMGSDVETREGAFEISIVAAEDVHELQIVRNGEEWRQIPVGKSVFTRSWTVSLKEPGEFWYCRIIFTNGEVAWTSPIWLD